MENILDYISGGGGNGGKVYKPSELIVDAKDKGDALKRFQVDQGRFVRPVVCFILFPLLLRLIYDMFFFFFFFFGYWVYVHFCNTNTNANANWY